MTIDKAIKNLTYLKDHDYLREGAPNHESLKLGIEALKQIKYLHEIYILHDNELLPGETKE